MKTIALLLAATMVAGAQTEIGTFDRTKVLVATLQTNQVGRDQQELAHRQHEGKAPLDGIFAVRGPRLREVKHSAEVAELQEKVKAGEEAGDVTDRVEELMK